MASFSIVGDYVGSFASGYKVWKKSETITSELAAEMEVKRLKAQINNLWKRFETTGDEEAGRIALELLDKTEELQ